MSTEESTVIQENESRPGPSQGVKCWSVLGAGGASGLEGTTGPSRQTAFPSTGSCTARVLSGQKAALDLVGVFLGENDEGGQPREISMHTKE